MAVSNEGTGGVVVTTKTPEERKEALARQINTMVSQGFRVETQSDFQAVVVKGKDVNHILHLFITLITLGLWVVVWIGLALMGGEKRNIVGIDEYGNVNLQKV